MRKPKSRIKGCNEANRNLGLCRYISKSVLKMSNPPSFNFGQTTTSGGTASNTASTTSNFFAQNPPSSASEQGGVFGTSAAPPASTISNLFGKPPASSASSLFNLGAGQASATAGGVSSPFGSDKKSTPTSFNFGQPSQAGGANFTNTSNLLTPNKTSESMTGKSQPANPFGESTTVGTGAFLGNSNPSGASSNQLGASTPISKPSFGNFLATSTTPAGPPPSGPGAVGNTASIFNPTRSQAPIPLSLGATSTLQPTAQDAKSIAAPASVFGGTTAPTGGLFGLKKPMESDTVKPNPFDKLNKFKDKDPSSSTPSATGASATQQPSTAATKSSGFFPPLGGQATSGNPLFGASSQTISPSVSAPSLYPSIATSQAGTTNVTTPSASSVDFGLKAAAGSSGPSASNTTTAASSGLLFPTNPLKSATLPPATAPTGSNVEGQQPLPPASAKSSMFGNQGQPASSSSAQAATSLASETPANLAAGLGTSTAGPAPPAQSRLKNKSMDEIITRWASDLSNYQKEFQKQAEVVSAWDRMLVENSDKIQKLYGSTLEAERATTEVERQLTVVENDQAELQLWLEHYEQELSQMMSNQVGPGESLQGTDQERDKT